MKHLRINYELCDYSLLLLKMAGTRWMSYDSNGFDVAAAPNQNERAAR